GTGLVAEDANEAKVADLGGVTDNEQVGRLDVTVLNADGALPEVVAGVVEIVDGAGCVFQVVEQFDRRNALDPGLLALLEGVEQALLAQPHRDDHLGGGAGDPGRAASGVVVDVDEVAAVVLEPEAKERDQIGVAQFAQQTDSAELLEPLIAAQADDLDGHLDA